MSAAIDTVRAIIQDQPVLVQQDLVLSGSQTAARAQFFPLISASLAVTGIAAPTTITEQSGLLQWGAAPAAGTWQLQYNFVQLLDATIQQFLTLQADVWSAVETDSSVTRMAAAMALDAIASSMAVILRRIELLDLKIDGPAVAKALRDHAENLRKEVTDPAFQEPTFDIIEQINDVAGYREKIYKDWLREF